MTQPPAQDQQDQQDQMIDGVISNVDAASRIFSVHPRNGPDVDLKVNDRTTYYVGSSRGTWDDLKQGSSVTVQYSFDGTDNWALRVEEPQEKPPPH